MFFTGLCVLHCYLLVYGGYALVSGRHDGPYTHALNLP